MSLALREDANIPCWLEQSSMEGHHPATIGITGLKAVRGHGPDSAVHTIYRRHRKAVLITCRQAVTLRSCHWQPAAFGPSDPMGNIVRLACGCTITLWHVKVPPLVAQRTDGAVSKHRDR